MLTQNNRLIKTAFHRSSKEPVQILCVCPAPPPLLEWKAEVLPSKLWHRYTFSASCQSSGSANSTEGPSDEPDLALWSVLLCAYHAAEVKIYQDGRLRRRTKLGKWLWEVFLTCDERFPIVTLRNPVKVRSKPGRLTTVGRTPKWSVALQWLL